MKSRSCGFPRRVFGGGLLLSVLLFSGSLAAQIATWVAPGPFVPAAFDPVLGYVPFVYAPPGNWSDPANWDAGVVPNGPSAVAVVHGFSLGFYSLPGKTYPGANEILLGSGAVSLSELRFQTGDGPTEHIPSLTIGTDASSAALALTGAGLTWQIGLEGNYVGAPYITVRSGLLEFDNQASALGSIFVWSPDGQVVFRGQSSAARASIWGGSVDFYDQATAGQASFTLYGSTGLTFHDHSTFDHATLSSSGDLTVSFKDYASAGSMQVSRPFSAPPWPTSRVFFSDHATAADADLEASVVVFSDQATAASSHIRNIGGQVNESHGYYATFPAELVFNDQSTAGQAVITNGAIGTLTFGGMSSAGTASITNSGTLVFMEQATFADAHLVSSSGTMLSGNFEHVDPWGELYFTQQVVTTGRITFMDGAAGGGGRIDIASADSIIDFSGLRTYPAAGDGRAALPVAPTIEATVPNDAATISFGSINNTTPGGTIYLGGTRLRLGSDNSDMTLSALVSDVGGAFGTEAGAPLEGGGLDKTGAGTLTISNPANYYAGLTAIQQGRLHLNNGRISSATIAPGASLTGNGTVGGSLANSGLLSPGNSPGTITIQGNYVQSPTGALSVDLYSPTSFDQVLVTGTAALGGALTLTAPQGFATVGNARISFLSAGSVSGRFDQVILAPSLRQRLGAALTSQLTYFNGGASLQITQLPFSGFGGSSIDAAALGEHLDATLGSSRGDYRSLIAGLNAIGSSGELAAALGALSPDRYSLLAESAFDAAAFQRTDLDRRLAAVRSAAGRNLNLYFEAGTRSTDYSSTSVVGAGHSRLDRGVAGGIWSNRELSFGASVESESNAVRLDSLGSSASVKSLVPEVLAQYEDGRNFVNASAAWSTDDYDLHRRIVYAGNDQTAVASVSGSRVDLAANAGRSIIVGAWEITPVVGVLASTIRVNDFAEAGAAGASMSISDWTNRSLRSRAGVEVTRREGRLTPRIFVTWLHEFHGERSFDAQFTGASGAPYAVPGRPAGSDRVQANLALEGRLGKTVAGYASIGGAWESHAHTNPDVTAGVRREFYPGPMNFGPPHGTRLSVMRKALRRLRDRTVLRCVFSGRNFP